MRAEIDVGNPPAGYALKSASAKQKTVNVLYREFTSSEDGQYFIQRLEGHPSSILKSLPSEVRPSQIDHLLAVFHRNGKASVYVNDLEFFADVRVARSVKAGQNVMKDDISDIERYELGVSVPEDAGFLFVFSIGWRKGLIYDFGPTVGPAFPRRTYDLGKILAQAYCHDLFQERFSISDDEWTALLSAKWFPFVGLGSTMIDGLLGCVRSDSDLDEQLDRIVLDVQKRVGQMLNSWSTLPSITPHIEILERAVERFQNDDFISCTALLFPRIEGILRTRHESLRSGKKPFPKNLIESAVSDKLGNIRSLLLPHHFARYLREVYFAEFSPKERNIGVSRHSIGHGVADPSSFDKKSAVIGLLIVDQLTRFPLNDAGESVKS